MLGLLIGHTVLSLPYVSLMVSSVLLWFDRTLEEVAGFLGASHCVTFRQITLPILQGGVISGAPFPFITSFDQFPISLLLVRVGNATLPIQLFDYLRFSYELMTAAASTVSVALSVAGVWLIHRLVGLEQVTWGGPR